MNRTLFAALVSGCVLGACSGSRLATPEEADDAAQAIGALVAAGGGGGDVASMTDSLQIALGEVPRGFERTHDGRIAGRRVNLDVHYMVTCKDAAGMILRRCDRTTDEATVDVAWTGSLDTPSFDAMMNRVGTWTLSGLRSEIPMFTGVSAFASSATLTPLFRPGVMMMYEFDTAAAYNAIHITTRGHRPIDGSASFDVSARRTVTGTRHDVDASFTVHAEVIFHADHTASLVIDGARRYLIDLDTGVVVRVN